jgi:putative Mg2+ transporter-C (MgtC) family protein
MLSHETPAYPRRQQASRGGAHVHNVEWSLVANIAVGWALTFVLGFEREVRGAPGGDRMFSMIGLSTALIGSIAPHYPAALGGAVTGIGFIGGGLCFRQAVKQAEQDTQILHGVTTAASVFGAAAIGAIAGVGDLVLATAATLGILLSLEIRHLPLLRYLDARRWAYLFNDDGHRHFSLNDLEHAITHPHQEYEVLRSQFTDHEREQERENEHEAADTLQGNGHDGISIVGPIEDDSLVKQGETASILASQAIQAGIARGGR